MSSDSSLNKIIQYGTTADRMAFTPNPAIGSKVLYIWFDSDNEPDTYVWDGSAWVQINSSSSGITELTGDVTAGPGSGSQVATIPPTTVTEAQQNVTDVTTANVTSSAHGYAPKSPADATKFLNGAATPAFAQVKDSDLSLSNITTNDVSITEHGFAPKAPNDSSKFLDGTGAYSIPAGTGGNVNAGATLTDHELVIGQGSTDVAALGDLGTVNKVLHGNASGDPSFSAVDLTVDVTGALPTTNLTTPVKTRQLQFTIDNSGTAIVTGIAADLFVAYACTITAATIIADQSGSCVLDVWVTNAFSTIPTVANTIVASAPPTLSSAVGSQDATLTGWTTSVAAGSRFRINVNSASTVTRVQLVLTVTL